MRIAFLCKRHYTGKDVLVDRYGRLFELPHQLARRGHELKVFCLDYRGSRDEHQQESAGLGSMSWISFAVGGIRAARIITLPGRLLKTFGKFKPDVVIGASDIPHVALAAWLGRQLEVLSAIDLYDNFESFAQARIPGFRTLLRYAIRNAGLVTTVSHTLREKVYRDYAPPGAMLVIPNGINTAAFFPSPRAQARSGLGLPERARLVGTAGGLSRMKGLDVVYAAWQMLAQSRPDLHLVLAGPVERALRIPEGPRVHYLGELTEECVAKLFSALDVGIISLHDSSFGRYCFPQKAHEMLACGLPVVATDVGEMASFFSAWPSLLFPADDPRAMAAAVMAQLDEPVVPSIAIADWQQLAAQLETELRTLLVP